jgi:hypothetical protein
LQALGAADTHAQAGPENAHHRGPRTWLRDEEATVPQPCQTQDSVADQEHAARTFAMNGSTHSGARAFRGKYSHDG